jgi:tRNA pseudouridine(55) synthase
LKKIILLNKNEGETPLYALECFRATYVEYKDVLLTYAGRLDPMASGALLILCGDESKNKEKYLALDKEYEFEILFGFATDTYDILGKITSCFKEELEQKLVEKEIKENLKHFKGEFMQKYPMYSSKTVGGKPLFQYAREGIKIEVPERKVLVKNLKFTGIRKIKKEKLFQNIQKRINKTKGDFRQTKILYIWQKILRGEQSPMYKLSVNLNKSFLLAKFKIKCSSGTYVRSIANALGEKIKIPALAFSIKRTKIGKWSKMLEL